MKALHWIDDNGYGRVSIVRDEDGELEASSGLQRGPPDITTLDWENVVKDLHNALVSRSLFTYKDVIKSKNGVSSAIISALRRKVVTLYKQQR